MHKAIILSFFLAACSLPESSIESESGNCGYESACPDAPAPQPDAPPPQNGPTCPIDGTDVALDTQPANVDNNDRKVTFCHATSSATNPFVMITTSIRACRAHETHTKLPKGGERDRFPTGGCQD